MLVSEPVWIGPLTRTLPVAVTSKLRLDVTGPVVSAPEVKLANPPMFSAPVSTAPTALIVTSVPVVIAAEVNPWDVAAWKKFPVLTAPLIVIAPGAATGVAAKTRSGL